MKTCYKVVKRENDQLVSCIATDQAKTVYELNKWIKAPEWLRKNNRGPLAFKTLDQASHFTHNVNKDNFEIWECRYRHEINDLIYFSLVGLSVGKLNASYSNCFPEGTIQVEQIKLIRKVS